MWNNKENVCSVYCFCICILLLLMWCNGYIVWIGVCFKMYNVLLEIKFVNYNIKIVDVFIMIYLVIYIYIIVI